MALRALLPALACLFTATAIAQPTTFIVHEDAYCGLNNGWARVYPISDPALFTYLWSNGETTVEVDSLAPGNYSVDVIDLDGDVVQVSVTIGMEPGLPVTGTWIVACAPGTCEGKVYVETASDLNAQPITYSVDPPQCTLADPDHDLWPTGAGAFILNLAGGITYTVTATDANGCSGSIMGMVDTLGPQVMYGYPSWSNSVDQLVPECGTAGNGSFRVIPQGEWNTWHLIGPDSNRFFTFTEQPYIFTGLEAGTYRVRRSLFIDNSTYFGDCEELEVVIPFIPEPCTGVMGAVHHDADEDCVEAISKMIEGT